MDLEKQKLLLNNLISDNNLFILCNSIIKPSYFDASIRKVIVFVQEYFEKYKNLPDIQIIKAETGIQVSKQELSKDKIKYASDQIEEFCKKKAIESALINSVPLLEKEDYGKIESLIKEAISVGLIKDLGTDYFKDPVARLTDTLQTTKPILTGWPELDAHIGGGLFRQELTLFMANSGVGKSIMLSNLTANVLKQKLNVVYITLELAEKVVAKRIDSMMTGVAQKYILSNIPKVASDLEKIRNNCGKLFVKRMRESTTNAKHIITYLKEFQDTTGENVDLLVIDYLDIMAPIQKIAADNLFGKDKYLSEEVRAIGFDFDCAIASASQMGRCLSVNSIVNIKDKGLIKIKDVEINDLIETNTGFNKIINKTKIEKQKCFKIYLKSGKTIICSANHVFPTNNGNLSINSGLTIGDKLYSKNDQ